MPLSIKTGAVKVKDSEGDYVDIDLTLSDGYAPLESPAFTGTPTAPTPGVSDDSTKIATTAFVQDVADNLNGAINAKPNPNLLDNWYFVGGGSQAGVGKFPINQRGQTSYSSGYGIDRWNAVNASYPIAIPNANGVTGNLRQFLEVERIKNGYTYTATLFSSKGIDSASAVLNSSVSGWQISAGGGTAWLGVRFDSGKWDVRITGTETFYAVKLELGDTQTLVHQENSSWILNEIPNYQEELVKCIGSHADSDDTYANNDYAKINQIPNTNLLDNWYFPSAVNSKNLSGTFTVSSNTELYDKWNCDSGSVTINSNGSITINTNLFQTVNKVVTDSVLGKTITISVLTNSNFYTETYTFPSTRPLSTTVYGTGYVRYALYAAADGRSQIARFTSQVGAEGIVAAKVELGTKQTLAHQENGVWVLNDVPNYDAERTKVNNINRTITASNITSGVTVTCNREANVVRLDCGIVSGSKVSFASGTTAFAVLPEAARPPANVYFPIIVRIDGQSTFDSTPRYGAVFPNGSVAINSTGLTNVVQMVFGQTYFV